MSVMVGAANLAGAGLTWQQERITAKLPVGETHYEAVYPFTNASDQVILIQDLVVDCDCSTAELVDRQLAPGETGEIGLRIDARGLSGVIKRKLKVIMRTENEPTPFSHALWLELEVTPWLTFSPRVLFWKKDSETVERSLVITVHPGSEAKLRLGKVPEGISGSLKATDTANRYQFSARPRTTTEDQSWHVPVELWSESELVERIEIYALIR